MLVSTGEGVWWRVSARAVYQLTLCERRAEAALDTRVFAPHTTQRGWRRRTVDCGLEDEKSKNRERSCAERRQQT